MSGGDFRSATAAPAASGAAPPAWPPFHRDHAVRGGSSIGLRAPFVAHPRGARGKGAKMKT